jgi:ABC-2 type transport system permease protein
MLGVILSTVLPTAILSGMIFPVESMPGWLQPVTYLVPARWFIDVVRGIMLKDAGLGTLWLETTVLVAMTAGLMTASVRSFRARLG